VYLFFYFICFCLFIPLFIFYFLILLFLLRFESWSCTRTKTTSTSIQGRGGGGLARYLPCLYSWAHQHCPRFACRLAHTHTSLHIQALSCGTDGTVTCGVSVLRRFHVATTWRRVPLHVQERLCSGLNDTGSSAVQGVPVFREASFVQSLTIPARQLYRVSQYSERHRLFRV
jgi:hypothetical protein